MIQESTTSSLDRKASLSVIELLAIEPEVQAGSEVTLSPTNLPDGQTNKDD